MLFLEENSIEDYIDLEILGESEELVFNNIKYLKDKNSVKRFFSENGISLDKKTEKFITDNNGGGPSKNTIKVKGTERVMNSLLSFNKDDKDNVYKAKLRVDADDASLIPIARDPSENYFCFKGKQIVFYSHEDGEWCEVSNSFINFISSLK